GVGAPVPIAVAWACPDLGRRDRGPDLHGFVAIAAVRDRDAGAAGPTDAADGTRGGALRVAALRIAAPARILRVTARIPGRRQDAVAVAAGLSALVTAMKHRCPRIAVSRPGMCGRCARSEQRAAQRSSERECTDPLTARHDRADVSGTV